MSSSQAGGSPRRQLKGELRPRLPLNWIESVRRPLALLSQRRNVQAA